MEELSEKAKELRSQVTWSLVEKFTEEMISKGVNLAELKKIVSFLVVMNADNVLKRDEKDILNFIENVHKSMLDLCRLHFDTLKFFSHEKDNTCIES